MSSIRQKQEATDYTRYNRVRLVQGGAAYFTRLKQIIDGARASLHLQVYIFAADDTGRDVADRLIAASGRGVAVYVVADGYTSQHLPSSFVHRLRAAGVHFRFFEPVFRCRHYYFGRRLHHKLAVADGRHALVGGINISNSYNDLPGKPAWLDFALYVEGEAATALCELCRQTWRGFSDSDDLLPCSAGRQPLAIADEEASFVAIRRNDWVRGKIQVSKCYLEMFRQAQSEIVIVSSYFLPGRLFRKYMYAAAQRGVRVKVVLAGSSDVVIAKQAERYMYRRLLKKNIEIYEYHRAVLHAKMAIRDDNRLTIGSYNVNNISAFASMELNLDVSDGPFTQSVKQLVETIIARDCTRITEDYFYSKNHLLRRLWQETCYGLIRLILFLFTFYFRQEK